jgi:hypothetical protein
VDRVVHHAVWNGWRQTTSTSSVPDVS